MVNSSHESFNPRIEPDNLPRSAVVEEKNPEQLRPDVESIKEARNFFQSLGCSFDKDSGLITQGLDPERLARLKEWAESTIVDSGVMMDTEQDFYRKVLLAVSLWHQKEGLSINYLLGKGVGVEVALRGRVVDRTRRPIVFPYRSHADFELYGVDHDEPHDSHFQEVFPGQESFSSTRTKGLKNLPSHLLHETFETVDIGGVKVLVPQLELLFLDKYMAQESTPRQEGIDAELLARQYSLDRERIHQYAEQFVIQPTILEIEKTCSRYYGDQVTAINDGLIFIAQELRETGNTSSKQDLTRRLNEKVRSSIGINGADFSVTLNGINLGLWEDLEPEQIDEEGNIIDQTFLTKLQVKIRSLESSSVEAYKNLHRDLDSVLNKAESEFINTGAKQ